LTPGHVGVIPADAEHQREVLGWLADNCRIFRRFRRAPCGRRTILRLGHRPGTGGGDAAVLLFGQAVSRSASRASLTICSTSAREIPSGVSALHRLPRLLRGRRGGDQVERGGVDRQGIYRQIAGSEHLEDIDKTARCSLRPFQSPRHEGDEPLVVDALLDLDQLAADLNECR
jgi:hypothetical protein